MFSRKQTLVTIIDHQINFKLFYLGGPTAIIFKISVFNCLDKQCALLYTWLYSPLLFSPIHTTCKRLRFLLNSLKHSRNKRKEKGGGRIFYLYTVFFFKSIHQLAHIPFYLIILCFRQSIRLRIYTQHKISPKVAMQ